MNEMEFFETIKSYKLLTNKSLGQNFLTNSKIASEIVKKLQINDEDEVLEIGAGLGSLSYFLAKTNAKIELIDIDERMLTFLRENFDSQKNITIKRQNILKHDLGHYSKIIGNLPYYITSGIIAKILLSATSAKKIVLMTQKEVYPKLLKSFKSPLSLFLNYVCEISQPREVNRNSFTPVPHVDSVVFELIPNENIKNMENPKLFSLIQQLFLLRRKNILNNLANVIHDKEKAKKILDEMNVDINKRPEQLDIDFYKQLLNLL